MLFELECQLRLAHLATDGDIGGFGRKRRVANELLGDGGCAFDSAACEIVDKRSGDTGRIHAVVLVKTDVFDVYGRVDHIAANPFQLNRVAFFQLELREQGGPVAGVHIGIFGEIE